MIRKLTSIVALATCVILMAWTPALAADKPLSKDDVLLLVLAGTAKDKMLSLIDQRGVTFQMNPDLATQFHDAGASDEVIEALQKARKVEAAPASAPPGQAAPAATPAPATPAAAPPAAATSPVAKAAPASAPANPQPGDSETIPPPAEPKAKPVGLDLGDPSTDQVNKIIQEFAAKEKTFREARDNYTFHQINKVQELGPDGEVVGMYQQEWDILYDDAGKRIERVTYAPTDTLKRLLVTKEDIDSFRNIQPFVLTSDELPDYEIKYLGHVKVDEITAYVFSIRPKELKKGRQYFQGQVWVDDRDLQIVKSTGKPVPELKTKHGENLFPRFTTYREQVDGKYWFPTYTMADDTLYFATGSVRIKEVIRYTEYKQFKSKVRILTATPTDQPNAPPIPPAPDKQ